MTQQPDDLIPKKVMLLSGYLKTAIKALHTAPSNRAPGFHCSELAKFCPRQKVLSDIFPLPADQTDTFDSLVHARFNYGSALHDWYQNRYLGPAGLLIGRWECIHCGHIVGSKTRDGWLVMPRGVCSDCRMECDDCIWPEKDARNKCCQLCPHGGDWKYKEIPVEGPGGAYTGHTDGVVLLDGSQMLLELKSCGPRAYATLREPYPQHIVQANLYMGALGLNKALIVYIDKANEDPCLVKEFVFGFSQQSMDKTLASIELYKSSLQTKKLPGRTFCDTKQCPWARHCYDDDFIRERLEAWRNEPNGK